MGGSPSPDYPSPDLVPILPDLDLELNPAAGLPSPGRFEFFSKFNFKFWKIWKNFGKKFQFCKINFYWKCSMVND